jgi:hypothetical protein
MKHAALVLMLVALPPLRGHGAAQSSAKHADKTVTSSKGDLDAGKVMNNVYRNKTLGFSYKIPDGWVMRTDEMNAAPEKPTEKQEGNSADTKPAPASSTGAKVLLAAFSRPPEARGEEINSSVLIAAESVSNYPGLQEAAQYFYPLEEVAKAQGFQLNEDPYAIAIDTTTLVRGDFQKDVGTRVMRQSTLAMLSHGYAVSITVIAGTEDDIEGLIDGLSFTASAKSSKK